MGFAGRAFLAPVRHRRRSGVTPNTLVRFDPRTKQFSATPIASGGGVVRNMVSTPDGRLYLACSGVNKVAVADPAR